MDLEAFKAKIRQHFPQIPTQLLERAVPILEGWDSVVLDLDGEYIFCFPRRIEVRTQLKKEGRLLPVLAGHLAVPVPQFQFLGPDDRQEGTEFAGYPKLPGEALSMAATACLPVAQQLGGFLSDLHTFPVDKAIALGVPGGDPQGWRERYVELHIWARAHIFPRLPTDLRQSAERVFEAFLRTETHFRFQPVLIHADLVSEHILWDPDLERIQGVIDWGDAQLGDPALDFTGLYWLGGRAFVERVLCAYRLPPPESLWARIEFYTRCAPYYQIRFGLESGEQDHTEEGLKALRASLASLSPN
jgi:aminoglycoside 2''-phosphotransferase